MAHRDGQDFSHPLHGDKQCLACMVRLVVPQLQHVLQSVSMFECFLQRQPTHDMETCKCDYIRQNKKGRLMHHSIIMKRGKYTKCHGLLGRVVLFGLIKGSTHRAIDPCFIDRLNSRLITEPTKPLVVLAVFFLNFILFSSLRK